MTATEWRTEGGGFKDRSTGGFKRLPFYCCAIAFTPFEDPVRLFWIVISLPNTAAKFCSV